MNRRVQGAHVSVLLVLAAGAAAAQRGAAAVGDDVVARVDDVAITRRDLNEARRMLEAERHLRGELAHARRMLVAEQDGQLRTLAAEQRKPLPTNAALLDELIHRALWERYFARERLHPSGADIQAAIRRLAAEAAAKGSTYQRFLASRGLSPEAHAELLRHELAMERLTKRVQEQLPVREVRAEFDAHPHWYDGSRIRISELSVRTDHLAKEPEKLKRAKEHLERIHALLVAGKDFARLARDFSDSASAGKGGDVGWLTRKGEAALADSLVAAAWELKAGQFTGPVHGPRGWHFLKVTAREGAHFTYLGCRERIRSELARRRLEAVLGELRAKAKIEKFL